MVAANGMSLTLKPDAKAMPELARTTRDYLAKYDLDASSLPSYFIQSNDEPFDIVRLSGDQLARIPVPERPIVVPGRDKADHLLFIPCVA